ncbi:MAG TPA: hypothetical protein VNI56_01795, partial [Xanthomonadaceae bacterium]|nr:hypothetical protein [Xanthomonadaceae bacterium]
ADPPQCERHQQTENDQHAHHVETLPKTEIASLKSDSPIHCVQTPIATATGRDSQGSIRRARL